MTKKDKTKKLKNIWYKSLDNKTPDISVYSKATYCYNLIECWKTYSKNYMKKLQTLNFNPKEILSILDLGCGMGFTSITAKNIFPTANIVASNLENSLQYEIAKINAQLHNFSIISKDNQLKHFDLILAFEFFEHLERPLEYLKKILTLTTPKYLFIANSFNTEDIGHFRIYKDKHNEYNGKRISRLFNLILKNNNYYKVKTGFWNNRPTLWKLKNI